MNSLGSEGFGVSGSAVVCHVIICGDFPLRAVVAGGARVSRVPAWYVLYSPYSLRCALCVLSGSPSCEKC